MVLSLNQLESTTSPPAAPAHAGRVLRDSHGRTVQDLRLSVTDRCNFRCTYCMEPDDRFMPRRDLLSQSDYIRIVDAAMSVGVRKVRITGGEPTLYPDLDGLIEAIGRRGLDDLAMTTNGWRLDLDRARRWHDGGLDRLTFSLDTLREDRMERITRASTSVSTVLTSIGTARVAGFARPKVNVVAMRDVNDDEFIDFARLARQEDLDIRFIEFMPLDSGRAWARSEVVLAREIHEAISAYFPLTEMPGTSPHSTSTRYTFADGAPGAIGLIAPVSRPFCGACNRLRVTAEGAVRPCLFSRREWPLRALLASGATVEAVARFLCDAIWTKQPGHGIGSDGFEQPARGMSAIGG